jgi:hypothetical protein
MISSMVRILIALGAVVLLGMTSAVSASESEISVTLKAEPTRQGLLTVELRNDGEKAITMSSWNLPWSGAILSGLDLIVLPLTGKGETLKRVYPIRDPAGKVLISSKQVLTGTIDLRYQFPTISKVLGKEDVVVFWSYSPVIDENTRLAPKAGAVILRR